MLLAIPPLVLPVTFGHSCSPTQTFSAAIHLAIKCFAPSLFYRLAPFSLVLGCSRPLIGAHTESSEVVQQIPHPIVSLPPHADRAPSNFPSITHSGSLVSSMHAPNTVNRIRLLHTLDSMLSLPVYINKRVQIGNRVVGAILLRQPIQRVRNLWCTRRRVWQRHLRRLHATQPYSTVSNTSALSIRILSSSRALGRMYSSRVYFRELPRALRVRWSTSMNRSVLWLTAPPSYTNAFVWLCTWPAASTLKRAVVFGIPIVRKHMISVLASNTVRLNAEHTTTTTSILFLSCSGNCETTPASSV